jgi:hypothetical protein
MCSTVRNTVLSRVIDNPNSQLEHLRRLVANVLMHCIGHDVVAVYCAGRSLATTAQI